MFLSDYRLNSVAVVHMKIIYCGGGSPKYDIDEIDEEEKGLGPMCVRYITEETSLKPEHLPTDGHLRVLVSINCVILVSIVCGAVIYPCIL